MKNIVLIHGWSCDESIWRETKNYLSDKYRLFTINLPLMKERYSYRDAVIELIEQKGLTHVVLIGWSMGSIVALQVASHVPQKILGLVLVSGTCKFVEDIKTSVQAQTQTQVLDTETVDYRVPIMEDYQGGIPLVLITKMKKRLSKNPENTFNDFYKLMFSPNEQTNRIDDFVMENYLFRGRKWDLLEAQSGLDFLMETDVQACLADIICPTLLLHGQEDTICTLAGANFIRQQIPSAQLVSYPQVGHIPFLTEYRKFHHDLEEWLSTL